MRCDDDEDEDTWEETEEDAGATYVSLADSTETFTCVEAMLEHDKSLGVDLVDIAKSFRLDFYGAVRLVNYLRSHSVKDLRPEHCQDDRFLKPVLDDDALLTSLDDVLFSTEVDQPQDHSKYQRDLDRIAERLASSTQVVRDALEADQPGSFLPRLRKIVDDDDDDAKETASAALDEEDGDTNTVRALKRDLVNATEQLKLVQQRAAEIIRRSEQGR